MVLGSVAAVSYLNTIPFIYGIEHAVDLRADLLLSPPSTCTRNFAEGRADVALVPSGSLPSLKDARIVTPFCLGASGSVRTVVLVSDAPLDGIRRIWLDSHSLTSVRLVRILAGELWGIDPEWADLDDYAAVDDARPGDAFLLIGDKVFGYEGRFARSWDLADEWRRLTGLPFVFAVWVARGDRPENEQALTEALRYGLDHIPEAIARYGYTQPYALEYLTRNIDYKLDTFKRQALALFLDKAEKQNTNLVKK